MNDDKLARMANEIAAFFRPYPEAEACAGIQDHILAFWTPKMRIALLAHTAAGGEGLDPLTALAIRTWSDAESPASKERQSPAIAGQLASDAG